MCGVAKGAVHAASLAKRILQRRLLRLNAELTQERMWDKKSWWIDATMVYLYYTPNPSIYTTFGETQNCQIVKD